MLNNKEKLEGVLNENEKYFSFLIALPKITTIILGRACFVLGCVFVGIFEEGYFLAIFWLGGAVHCIINYYLFKLVLCYPILHICYMKQQLSKLDKE